MPKCNFSLLFLSLTIFLSLKVEKKSAAVSGFWKSINEEQKQREEKTAVQTALLGHLNIFGHSQVVRTGTEVNLFVEDPFLDYIFLMLFTVTSSHKTVTMSRTTKYKRKSKVLGL